MPFGYSQDFVTKVNAEYKQCPDNPVFQLGKLCVDHHIMLSEVADELALSKQGVYKWFSQGTKPKEDTMKNIKALVAKLKKKHAKKTKV